MLRIPLPEYDGFALREACKGLLACALQELRRRPFVP